MFSVFVILVLLIGKRGGKGKDKTKEPSDEELKTAIIDILKGVDFNTVRI